MTFLLVCKQKKKKKNLDTFEAFVAALLAEGHREVLTIQEREHARDARIAEQFSHPLLTIVGCPDGRSDDWRTAAPLVRTARDWMQYARPPYQRASKLADRAAARLGRELSAAAEDEPRFIASWLGAIRAARGPLATCNVVIRPHPDVPFEAAAEPEVVHWRGMPQATGWAYRPFDDARAVVLRTTYLTQEAFFECLHHANAVVALNTSAELEAGIAGRPVFTVLANDRSADGQAHTLHFNYPLREHGGFVSYANELQSHVAQLESALIEPPPARDIQRFVREVLRPPGDEPVAPLLARMVAERALAVRNNRAPGSRLRDSRRLSPRRSHRRPRNRPPWPSSLDLPLQDAVRVTSSRTNVAGPCCRCPRLSALPPGSSSWTIPTRRAATSTRWAPVPGEALATDPTRAMCSPYAPRRSTRWWLAMGCPHRRPSGWL